MLRYENTIPYEDGLRKYLPDRDESLTTCGVWCWFLFKKHFVRCRLESNNNTHYLLHLLDGTPVIVRANQVYSDKTLAEAIERLAAEESNKKLETVAQKEQGEFDIVKKPKHYMLFPEAGIEVRDLVKILLNRASSNGFTDSMFLSDQAQMLQYILRFDAKNGKEDLEKARWYLDKMIEQLVDN